MARPTPWASGRRDKSCCFAFAPYAALPPLRCAVAEARCRGGEGGVRLTKNAEPPPLAARSPRDGANPTSQNNQHPINPPLQFGAMARPPPWASGRRNKSQWFAFAPCAALPPLRWGVAGAGCRGRGGGVEGKRRTPNPLSPLARPNTGQTQHATTTRKPIHPPL